MSESICCPLGRGDDDAATVYNDDIVVARKEHRCTECRKPIVKGEKYELAKGCWDGSWSTFKTCLLCVEIRNRFACQEGWLFGEVWNQLEENFFPEMAAGGPCMEGLSPQAKQKLIDMRMEWYFQHEEIDDRRWKDWESKRPTP